MNDTIIANRLAELRNYMRSNKLDAFIFPSSDSHSSEYVAEFWKSRQWISGFTGSAGTVVVTLKKVALWTDSRYWLSADEQLSKSEIILMKDGLPQTPNIPQWIVDNIDKGSVVAFDATVCSISVVEEWRDIFTKNGLEINSSLDPMSVIWENRPSIPTSPIIDFPIEQCGESASEKISRLRVIMKSQSIDRIFVSMLDEIAWLLNIRATDIEFNPVAIAYLVVTQSDTYLYINEEKLSPSINKRLNYDDIKIESYNMVWDRLREYNKGNILLQPSRCNYAVLEVINSNCKVIRGESPISAMKAIKNETEIAGYKKAMLSEGLAMVKFLYWLKQEVNKGEVTELSASDKLFALRAEDGTFCSLSFATISAYAHHGAIVHYQPDEQSDIPLEPRGFLLLDSGGQYINGTTDVTRTIALGELTREECEDYTRVLRGHISLAMSQFPEGTSGTQLDVLARQWLWRAGENYLHGTGHGVGHFLNVHEGPHQIRMNYMPAPLLPGMTITNEPGLYKMGRYGIRIENTMLILHSQESEFGRFCRLEPLTLCPIDKSPIIRELLGVDEINYLNNYHKLLFEKLAPLLDGELLEFLELACEPI